MRSKEIKKKNPQGYPAPLQSSRQHDRTAMARFQPSAKTYVHRRLEFTRLRAQHDLNNLRGRRPQYATPPPASEQGRDPRPMDGYMNIKKIKKKKMQGYLFVHFINKGIHHVRQPRLGGGI